MPPPTPDRRPGFNSQQKPRVLSQDELLRRSLRPEPSTATPTTTVPTSSAPSSPAQVASSTRPSLLSRFRTSFARLPAPVRRTFRVARVLAPIVPIGLFFSEHVLQVMWVRGPSMTPYLNEDYAQMHTKSDMVLVNMWPWGGWPWERRRRLERGMVVTFRSPANPDNIAIKRVIALPGDRVTTREPCPRESQIVPFNHVWLEGDSDDPNKSLDSNTYGPVSISLITGRVLAVLWPRTRLLRWWDWEHKEDNGISDKREPKYGTAVRDRVLKEAVKLERPVLE
ncbi:hypothetical protein Plec18167_004651 [Paecilomyces lecythidis]|uniref:Mitochondrial inner membrane protease subunit 2 n=1 Tax=Paecilomyces lecythidis TaxID=3004212 RepID=A0ABR3XPL9_9EURO